MPRGVTGTSRLLARPFLGELDAPFDFPHGVEILGHSIAIARTQAALQTPDLAGDRVEDAALGFDAAASLVGVGAVSEHPVEHDARIDLHRHRRRRRAPGNRVHVGAAEADVARSDQAAVVLDGQFERRQQRVLADFRRGDLIDRHAGVDVGAVGALGMNAVQKDGRAACVIAAVVAGTLRAGHGVGQIADDHDLILVRLERRQDRRELKRPFRRRASSSPSPRRAA